jgi:anti-sigma regulatory factor (Ser/Thr protein kinase)
VTTTADPFVHPALLYRDVDDYLSSTVPFLTEGLAADEPVAVAVPGDNLTRLRDALGADAARVRWRDMTVAGRNPGRIIPTVLLAFADSHPGRRVRIIGEPVWAGRSATEYPACAQHEALINAAFAGRAATILCPYDVTRLEPAWIEDAYRTHPVMFDATRRWASDHYDDPVAVAAGFNQPLPVPPPDAAVMRVEFDTLSAVRRFVTERATAAGMTPAAVTDLTIAINELAANAVEHGGGSGELALWPDGDYLVAQVTDAGRLTDPLIGRIPVGPDVPGGGRGLLLVNQLCDLVRTYAGPDGTTTRVHVHR